MIKSTAINPAACRVCRGPACACPYPVTAGTRPRALLLVALLVTSLLWPVTVLRSATPSSGEHLPPSRLPPTNIASQRSGEPLPAEVLPLPATSTQDDTLNRLPSFPNGQVPYDPRVFTPDPEYEGMGYHPGVEWGVYDDKYLTPVQRPWVELGRGFYLPGRLPPAQTWCGTHNLVRQHFLVYGDFRSGAAFVQNQGHDEVVWANRLNLDFDWKITDTERIHAFTGPLDQGANVTRLVHDHGKTRLVDELDNNWDTIYFEGDIGAMLGGWLGHDSRFDMPITIGLVPLLFQNGIWMEDALLGAAITVPARHSAHFDWSNYDLTLFAVIDELNSPAFAGDDSAADAYGLMWFLEAYGGYLELGYSYLDDQTRFERSYHNLGVSWTRRYLQRVSNSVRMIVNAGQDPAIGPRTADGCLVLLENSWISSRPNTFVPYCNCFAGFGRPQSVARAAVSGGILRNTGILFETDGLTGFPLLDDTANNTYGGAVGLNWLGPEFNYQVIVEAAVVQTFGRAGARKAVDDQYGLGIRYQVPLTNAWLMRLDGLYGFCENDDDLAGARCEFRHKF